MRYDDPSVFWDMLGFFYDMQEEAGPQMKHTMAKPKVDLRGKKPLEKVQKTGEIVTSTTGNANFPTPNPTLATLTAKADSLAAAISARDIAKQTLDEMQAALLTAEAELDATLTLFAAYVESASGGDAQKILSSGLALKGQASPVAAMPKVTGLDSTGSESEGSVILRWDALKNAKTYEVQTCPDPITGGGWTSAGLPTKSTLTVSGLPTGGRCWFRVRAVGSAGPGPWSDPCVKTVP
jgi:hypothetical protein